MSRDPLIPGEDHLDPDDDGRTRALYQPGGDEGRTEPGHRGDDADLPSTPTAPDSDSEATSPATGDTVGYDPSSEAGDTGATERLSSTGSGPITGPTERMHDGPSDDATARFGSSLAAGTGPTAGSTPPSRSIHSSATSPTASFKGARLPTTQLEPGLVLFDRYRVESHLGDGGMGQVWLVRHLELDDLRVFKQIRAEHAVNEEYRHRLRREAKAMARIKHPNAVRVHDIFVASDLAFIEMEYVPGRTLKDCLREGVRFDLGRVRRFLSQLCGVLEELHRHGIVHRDLKPTNLMIVEGETPNDEQLKVLDFGIAKIRDQDGEDRMTTASGAMLGTVAYMSPEQIRGKVDGRSDLYAVGVILYELLVGARPFTGPDYKLIHDHLDTLPPPFAEIDPQTQVPPEVERVVMRCLEKNPDDRPQTARDLVEEFEQACRKLGSSEMGRLLPPVPVAHGEATTAQATLQTPAPRVTPARPVAEPRQTPTPARRRVVPIAVAAALGLAALGAYSFWPGPERGGSSQAGLSKIDQPPPPPQPRIPLGYVAEGSETVGDLPMTLRHEKTGAQFVRLPGGQFFMGDGREGVASGNRSRPAHWVAISSLYLQETEVTFGQMERYFVETQTTPPVEYLEARDELVKLHGAEKANEHPAVGVPWTLARDVAKWFGGRLPTEAEWEFAARSGGMPGRWYVWGEAFGEGTPRAHLDVAEETDARTVPVTEFADTDKTVHGIVGLAGNVREWCLDPWSVYADAPESKPLSDPCPPVGSGGAETHRVIRGGSFDTPALATFDRDREAPGTRGYDLGFRVALPWPRDPIRMDQVALAPGKPVAPAPGQAAMGGWDRGPGVWAVVVGLGRYRDRGFRGDRGSRDDAVRVRDWLVQTGGWAPGRVLLLTDAGEPWGAERGEPPGHTLATREALDRAVGEWLPQKAKPGDLVLLFFAGKAAKLATGEGGGSQTVLVPYDADDAYLDRSGWAAGDALGRLTAHGDVSVLSVVQASFVSDQAAGPLADDLARWPGMAAWVGTAGRSNPVDDVAGPVVRSWLGSLGSSRSPATIERSLARLRRSEIGPGLETRGSVRPGLSLWTGEYRVTVPEADERLLVQQGHSDRVMAVAYSASGDRLISAGEDSTVRFWRPSDQKLLRVLADHTNGVEHLARSPDGRLLASGGNDGRVRVWDLERDAEVPLDARAAAALAGLRIADLAFLADGRHLAAGTVDGRRVLWGPGEGPNLSMVTVGDVERLGRLVRTATDSDENLWACVAMPEGRREFVEVWRGRADVPQELPALESGRIESLALSDDGRWLAVGTDTGNLELREVGESDAPVRWATKLEGPVGHLRFGSDWLLVQAGKTATVHSLTNPDEPARLDVEVEFRSSEIGAGGRLLAAVDRMGKIYAWSFDGDSLHPEPISLAEAGEGAWTSVTLAPDSETLAAGGQDGAMRAWSLPGGRLKTVIERHRGQVVHLAVGPEARHVLQVDLDGRARVWDVTGRRIVTLRDPTGAPLEALAGGTFLGGPGGLAVATRQGPVVVDLPSLELHEVAFEGPKDGADGEPITSEITLLASDPAGRWLVGASREAPLVCVWDTKDGRLKSLQRRRPHDAGLVGLGFLDADHLATASEDGVVARWTIGADGTLNADSEPFRAPDDHVIQSFVVNPARAGVVALAIDTGRGSRVEVRDLRAGKVVGEAEVGGTIRSLGFESSGRFLAAASDGAKRPLAWDLDDGLAAVRLPLNTQHEERLTSLAAWTAAGPAVVASGSLDTTIRLWDLAVAAPVATLCAGEDDATWVATVPDGRFDGTTRGLGRLSRAWGDEVVDFEQAVDREFVYGLADRLRKGKLGPGEGRAEGVPPRLALAVGERGEGARRRVRLTLRAGEGELTDLRLYHNGVTVRTGLDAELDRQGRWVDVELNLAEGENRFYAMAGRPGSLDGRSNEVRVRHEGPTEGRTHVLALGVGNYRDRPLKFAGADATSVAGHVSHQAPEAEPGREAAEPIPLVDDQVSRSRVAEALAELRRRTQDHPEDRVVVFLAGHTDMRNGRYVLLLHQANLDDQADDKVDADRDPTLLPYADLYRGLGRLDALNRLVIIDACQPGAIFEDQRVQRIAEAVERGAHASRTSYLLSTQPGESEALGHGLLTYTILRGLGAPGLQAPPPGAQLDRIPSADLDRDLKVDTDELRTYVERVLPALASSLPAITPRGDGTGGNATPVRPETDSGPRFPLVRLGAQEG